MAKFLNYLNEKDFTVPEIIEILTKDCKPYLKQLTKKNFKDKNLLISGRKDSISFGVKNIRKDRKPRDTKLDIHKWIDEQFYEKFKIKARSQTLFCTSDFDQASNFGDTHYIFPIGDFEIIWSKEYIDLYNRAYMDMGLERYQDHFLENVLSTYVKGNLKQALKSKNEIMLYCKSFRYYLIDTWWHFGKSVNDFFQQIL